MLLWNDMTSDLSASQQINFPGLDESDLAHFLSSLRRLNQIAEVQKSRKSLLHGKKYQTDCVL